ncbi:3702_t:CDS:2 [Ambispora gerdemannii]|uniref:3702_t:CDS:1 n=1 Tax=Ambispora gerdemannii TaxID=144530 RepID=A0A9N8V396_9GLOM|nr:3702_t:CDS:2 [Ambispora gerdemannii]
MSNLTIPNLPHSPTSQSITDSSSLISNASPSSPSSVSGGGEDNTKTPTKRKRLTQACDACRKKKVKCSGEKPSCQNCQRLKVACTYIPSTKKRGPRVGLVESLEKRLQQMEKLLQPLKEQGLVEDIEDRDIPSTPTKRPRLASTDSKNSLASFDGNQSQQFSNLNAANAERIQAPKAEFSNANVNMKSFGAMMNRNPEDHLKNFTELSPLLTPQSGSPIRQHTPTTPMSSQFSITEKSQLTPPQQSQQLSQQTTGQVISNEKNNEPEEDVLLYFGSTSARPGFRTCQELFGSMNWTDLPALSDPSSALSNNASTSSSFDPPPTREVGPLICYPLRMKNLRNDLPKKDVILHLAEYFFRYSYPQMPMFHKTTLLRRLEENKVSPFLIYSLCAVNREGIITNPPYLAGEPFADIATSMILDSFDEPTVEHCQALLLMALHQYGTMRGPRSWLYVSLAIRMAQELGLHKEFEGPTLGSSQKIDSEAAFIEREIRRRTFWCCFVIDRFSACALGRPTIIDEADIEIRLPIPDRDWELEHPIVVDTEFGRLKKVEVSKDGCMILENKGLFALLVSAAALLGRVAQMINRAKANETLQPWNPESQYSILSQQIEKWYSELCPNMIWSKERLTQHLEYNVGAAYATIHLLYYATIVILNRPHIGMLQNAEVPVEHYDFVRMSVDHCKNAARAVSEIANAVLKTNCFHLCPFVLYPLFAASTIHINETSKNDGADSEMAKKYLCVNLQFMKSMQPWWAMAAKLHCMLKEMYKRSTEASGLMEFWNCSNIQTKPIPKNRESAMTTIDNVSQNFSIPESNFGFQSILLPGEFTSPRIFMNETANVPESWYSMLKTPSPRPFFRPNINKNENGEYIGDDYFSLYNSELPNGFSYDALLNDALNNETSISFDLLSPGRVSRTGPVKYLMNEAVINAGGGQMSTGSTTGNTNSQVVQQQQQLNEQNTFSLISAIVPPSSSRTVL